MLSKTMHHLLLCGLSCVSIGTLCAHEGACANRITINHALIGISDGTSNIDFVEILSLEQNIKKVRSEISNKPLAETVSKIVDVSMDYLNKAGANRPYFFSLIRQWSEQRQRQGSCLCRQWCAQVEGDERALLRASLATLADVEQFLSDLDCFLKDLRNSCPKSAEKFKKMLAEVRAKRARGEL